MLNEEECTTDREEHLCNDQSPLYDRGMCMESATHQDNGHSSAQHRYRAQQGVHDADTAFQEGFVP